MLVDAQGVPAPRFAAVALLQPITLHPLPSLPPPPHTRAYSLASTYPRRVYGGTDLQLPLGELGLAPQAALLMQPAGDDEGED